MFFLHQFTSFFEDVLECIGPGWKCEANLFFFLFLMIVALYPFGLWSLYGYGSIPIDTFLVGWTSIYQLFWGSLGTRVLTHPHMMISLWFLPATKTADRDEPPSATAPRCRCANLRLVAQIAWQAHQLWQFVIWMTVWAPRMLKWDWNGIEMGLKWGWIKTYHPMLHMLHYIWGLYQLFWCEDRGIPRVLTAQASWRSCWAWMGTSPTRTTMVRPHCEDSVVDGSDGNVGTIIINHPFGNGNHTSY